MTCRQKVSKHIIWALKKASVGKFSTIFKTEDGNMSISSAIGGVASILSIGIVLILGFFLFTQAIVSNEY
jgi:hypothetical protein